MRMVAFDLEGSGAQDREAEAILEIAAVSLTHHRRPDLADAFTSLINPGRRVPMRPWISLGITNELLAQAPARGDVACELGRRMDGAYLIGHNIFIDWRLLHRHLLEITPVGLIDTLPLARAVWPGEKNSLTAAAQRSLEFSILFCVMTVCC